MALNVEQTIDNMMIEQSPIVENMIEPKSIDSLQELIQEIHNVLGPDGGLDSEHIDQNEIIRLMEKYNSNAEDWQHYAMFDRSRPYTRNLVDDGNGKVNILLIFFTVAVVANHYIIIIITIIHLSLFFILLIIVVFLF